MGPEEMRKEAIKRVKAKQGFWRLAGVFAIVWIILAAVWALSGGGYFWPIWAMFGMGIALLFVGWGAYGPQDKISEAQVDAEMRKMQGDS